MLSDKEINNLNMALDNFIIIGIHPKRLQDTQICTKDRDKFRFDLNPQIDENCIQVSNGNRNGINYIFSKDIELKKFDQYMKLKHLW